MNLGKTLRRLRTQAGFTQQDIADKLDVTRVAVGQWESDRAMPRKSKLQQLADLFGVTVSDLMGEEATTIASSSAELKKVTGGGSSMIEPIEVPSWVATAHPRGFFVVADEALTRRYPEGALLLVDPDVAPANNQAALFEVEGERICRVLLQGTSTTVLAADATDGTWPDIVSAQGHPPIECLGAIVWYMAPR